MGNKLGWTLFGVAVLFGVVDWVLPQLPAASPTEALWEGIQFASALGAALAFTNKKE